MDMLRVYPMKLACPDFHFVINIPENRVPVLVLERSDLFHRTISLLLDQSEGIAGPFVLSDNWEPLDFEKRVVVITDLFHLELNGRRQLAALTRQLNTLAVSEKHIQATYALQSDIVRWALDLENDLPYATIHNESVDVGAILKATGIRFDDEMTDTAERLSNFIKICAAYLGTRLIVVNSLHSHMPEQSLQEIYKTAMYEKVSILDVERYIPDMKLPCEQYYIIDRDNCEIYNNEDEDSL